MYRKIKIAIYLIGFIVTIFFYFRDGIISSHTPPLTFITAFIMLIISVIWVHVDYICSHLLSIYKTKLLEHQISIIGNLMFLFSILLCS